MSQRIVFPSVFSPDRLHLRLGRRLLVVCCAVWGVVSGHTADAGIVTFTDAASWNAAVPAPSSVDFDSLAHGSLSNQVAGLTFSAINSGNPRVSSAVSAQSGLNVMEVNPKVAGDFDGGGGVQIDFAAPQAAVAISYLDSEFAGNTITLLDSMNGVLATYELQYPHPNEWLFAGFVSTSGANIAAIQITVAGSDYVAFDDLLYGAEANPVPEPSSVLVLGLIAMPLVLRRTLRRA
ncbi:MAG: hypothetical protein JSS02_14820 [Planctomycetes bacterium]|nr:hypothetical protein [Planctomycetota bacterium]